MSTIKAANIQNPSAASAAIVLDTSGNFSVPAGTVSAPGIQAPSDSNTGIFFPAADTIAFAEGGTEAMRIDSSSRLLVGTSSARSNFNAGTPTVQFETAASNFSQGLSIVNNGGTGGYFPTLTLGTTRGTSVGSNTAIPSADYGLGRIDFAGADGTNLLTGARIDALSDGGWGTNDAPSRLSFSTTADGASSPTQRVLITSTGAFKQAGENASHVNTGQPYNEFVIDQTTADVVLLKQENTSSTENIISGYHARSASSSFRMMSLYSSGGSDLEFHLRGDGNAYCDGSWNGGGADYAEYFEWSDGNTADEDRCGISVVLENGKIREAVDGENPIGVISGNPTVTGDAAQDKWSGKHLTDDYGRYIWEDHNSVVWDETYTDEEGKEKTRRVKYEDWQIPAGVTVPANATISSHDENGNKLRHRVVNPVYDPDVEYIPRAERAEWDAVGLMGKLRIRKGQVTGSRWIKMRDISDSVEEWLVR